MRGVVNYSIALPSFREYATIISSKMTEEIASQKENYELGFHLVPELSEEEVQKAVDELSNLITSNEGMITFSKEPQKFRLAYPIKKKLGSYFGFIQFVAPRTIVDVIQEGLKLNNQVLRYVVVKPDTRQEKVKPQRQKRLTKEEKPAEKPGEVDKQLEEIIGNL